ncbi:hypothetical protein [Bradyrhizobium sp. SEMIA]|uniref:hypothetical protein n=1 Tax=Bradyrhizobium sp. SEMIA TaxID=2597515 RepID=UPI0018A4B8A0|nr:hypothetical protein [Bradyrhizobium sp. SEMIA]QOG17602.1 hypothetical protein FOM02_09875 [Bradyrhizobium sp. SEMIA]
MVGLTCTIITVTVSLLASALSRIVLSGLDPAGKVALNLSRLTRDPASLESDFDNTLGSSPEGGTRAMVTTELIGLVAVSFLPFLVSIGAVLVGGGPRKWPFLSYAFSFAACLVAGKGFGLLPWFICWMIAWVFAVIALQARVNSSIPTSPDNAQDQDAEAREGKSVSTEERQRASVPSPHSQ